MFTDYLLELVLLLSLKRRLAVATLGRGPTLSLLSTRTRTLVATLVKDCLNPSVLHKQNEKEVSRWDFL